MQYKSNFFSCLVLEILVYELKIEFEIFSRVENIGAENIGIELYLD
jgi:hypothetical protein